MWSCHPAGNHGSNKTVWDGKMAQVSGVLPHRPEDLSSILRTHPHSHMLSVAVTKGPERIQLGEGRDLLGLP